MRIQLSDPRQAQQRKRQRTAAQDAELKKHEKISKGGSRLKNIPSNCK